MHLFAIIGSATVVAVITLVIQPAQSGQDATPVEPNPRSAPIESGQGFGRDEPGLNIPLNHQLSDAIARMEDGGAFRIEVGSAAP